MTFNTGSDRTNGYGFSLKEGKFGLEVRKKFSECGEAKHKLPREVVDVPSLEVFKTRLDGALGSLI